MIEILLDNGFLVLCLSLFLSVLSLAIAVIAISRYKALYRKYDSFMRGRDAESLERLILHQQDDIDELKETEIYTKDSIRLMNRNIRSSIQKLGIVRYDAFEGMGGKMSFVLAMLDYTNTGIVLNCMHGREGCFLYIKEVDGGTTTTPLGSEEKTALEQALGYVDV